MCADSECGAAHVLVDFDSIESSTMLSQKIVLLKSFNCIYIKNENPEKTKLKRKELVQIMKIKNMFDMHYKKK